MSQYTNKIRVTFLGETHEKTIDELLAINPSPVVKAFLTDNECQKITVHLQGSGFVPVIYEKEFLDSGLAELAAMGNSLSRLGY